MKGWGILRIPTLLDRVSSTIGVGNHGPAKLGDQESARKSVIWSDKCPERIQLGVLPEFNLNWNCLASRSQILLWRSIWLDRRNHLHKRGDLSWRTMSNRSLPLISSQYRQSGSKYCTVSLSFGIIDDELSISTSPCILLLAGQHNRLLKPSDMTLCRSIWFVIVTASMAISSSNAWRTWASEKFSLLRSHLGKIHTANG